MKRNPFEQRVQALADCARQKSLDAVLVFGQANICSLTGISCDNAALLVRLLARGRMLLKFYTDFRYVPMVHRTAPWIAVGDIRKITFSARRVGCEFAMSHGRFVELQAAHPSVEFVDMTGDLQDGGRDSSSPCGGSARLCHLAGGERVVSRGDDRAGHGATDSAPDD